MKGVKSMILGAVMVPHPPIIVPQIGKGEEKAVQETIDNYHIAARQIAAWNPDVLVILSPHAEFYRDWFQVTPSGVIEGNFARFNAPNVTFRETVDKELVDEIDSLCREEYFPAGSDYPDQHQLDHGTMVPLYFIEQYIRDVLIVRIGLSGMSLQKHIEFGEIIEKAIANVGKKAVIVASGDLSHYSKASGPYGYRPESEEYNQRIMDVMGSGRLEELTDFSNRLCNQAGECGHRSFTVLSGILKKYSFITKRLSFEDTFGVAYGICTYTCRDPYVKLARDTIEKYVKREKIPEYNGPHDLTLYRAGAFVSIHKHHALRGCIGTFMPTKSNVAREIISNAIAACSRDPRFYPVTEKELADLEISVDILSEPEPISDKSELDIKKYGIIVTDSVGRRGLLLPDLDGVESIEHQISIAMSKAGIWDEDDIEIERFTVIRHEDTM